MANGRYVLRWSPPKKPCLLSTYRRGAFRKENERNVAFLWGSIGNLAAVANDFVWCAGRCRCPIFDQSAELGSRFWEETMFDAHYSRNIINHIQKTVLIYHKTCLLIILMERNNCTRSIVKSESMALPFPIFPCWGASILSLLRAIIPFLQVSQTGSVG